MSEPQKFRVTLRVTSNPEATDGKKVTEERIRIIIKNALDPDEMDDRISTVRVTDVIELTK
jgi:hypothetical protein